MIIECIWWGKRPRTAHTILKEKNKDRGLILPNSKTYYEVMTIKTVWNCWKIKKKQQQQPSNLFYKGAKAIWWNKDNFFNKSCWNKWISACKKKRKKKVNLDTNLIPFTNINSKYITDLNLTCKTMRVLEDNMGEISYDFENGNYFLDTTLKKWSMEEIIDKLDFIESKNILWKRISRKLKDKTQI